MMQQHSESVRFRSRMTFRDVISQISDATFRSAWAQGFGAWSLTLTVALVVSGQPWEAWVPGLIIAIGFFTGLPIAPVAWWSYSRRRDLLSEDVEADRSGLTIRSAAGENHQLWSAYRMARETSRTFVLLTGGVGGQIFPKGDMSGAEIEAFRGLLQGIGILRKPRTIDLARPALGLILGFVLALVFVSVYSGAPPV
jgi:YcxB-like protein